MVAHLGDGLLGKARHLLYENPEKIEIRKSEDGDFLWPSDSGFSIDRVLDMN